MTRWIAPHPPLLTLIAGLIAGTACWSSAWAQQPSPRERLLQQRQTQQQRQQSGQQQGTAVSDGVVRVQASLPDPIRMGEQFTYRITATNATDAVTVHDLKLRQAEAEGFTIESTSLEGSEQQQGQQQRQQRGQQQSEKQQQEKQQQEKQQQEKQQPEKQQPEKQQPEKQQKEKQAARSQGSQNSRTFNIGTLEPGQSKTVTVTAAADKEGELKSCLEIVSYTPAICLTSRVVKPELELVKTAPERASLCEVIEMEYAVKNGGSGDIQRFEIIDQLPKGLVTIEGEQQLRFPVDGLRAGDVRKFVARLRAQRAGEFSSRATAKATEGDLSARSQQATTRVEAADLQASIDAPSTMYSEEPIVFTARVANTGNVAAENVQVQVQWPADSRLVRMSDPQMTQAPQSQRQATDRQQVPKVAQQDKNSQQGKQQQRDPSAGQSTDMDQETFAVRRIDPGQAVEFRYLVRPSGRDAIPTVVVAQYVCDGAEAESLTTARAMASVDVVRLPALQIVAVDDADPVAAGKNVTYTVVVTNEGDAPDKQVTLKATLPDGLEFAEAKGPSEHSQEGSTVTFKPVESLQPGQDLRYRIVAKVKQGQQKEDVVFKAELNSETMRKTANAEEPTQLFAGQASSEQE